MYVYMDINKLINKLYINLLWFIIISSFCLILLFLYRAFKNICQLDDIFFKELYINYLLTSINMYNVCMYINK